MTRNHGLLAAALSAALITAPALFAQQQDGAPQPPTPPSAPGMPHPGGRHGQGGRGGDRHAEPHEGMGGPEDRLLPPGTWWRNPETAKAIGLTPDQQKHIDDLFLQSRVQLIDLHASLEKEQLLMEPLLAANPVDQGRALAQISKIADTRAALEKQDAKMLLSIRGVLTADQWTKLQDTHRHMTGGPKGAGAPRDEGGRGRGGQRGPGNGNGPMQPGGGGPTPGAGAPPQIGPASE